MAGPRNSFDRLAEEAAQRLDEARAQGRQLNLLGDQDPAAAEAGGRQRGKGKALSQMRDFLAVRGYRLPQEQLAQMAGLSGDGDPVLAAMTTAERVLAWAFAGKKDKEGNAILPGPSAFLHQFEVAYSIQLRAADAMLPYIAAKVSPDGPGAPVVNITVPAGATVQADPAAQARDITPRTPRASHRMMPADAAWEIEQNQQVAGGASGQSDAGSRTERASD